MKKNIYILSLISLTLFLQGCNLKNTSVLFNQTEVVKNEPKQNLPKQQEVNSTTQQNTSAIHKNLKFEYKIVPHDRISLIVYQHEDLTTTEKQGGLLIDSEGVISLPLLEDVSISGLTQKEAALKIQQGYDEYLNYSKVRLEVLNKRAFVIGAVKTPGPFPLVNEQVTLLQAIAEAGDFTGNANRQKVLVIKAISNGSKTSIIDLTDENSLLSANLMIQPNDIVYILPNTMTAVNDNIASITPIFQLISNILAPFVSFVYLKNN